MKKLLFILIFSFCCTTYSQTITRYIDNEFNVVETHINQVYATVPQLKDPYESENSIGYTNLTLDIFQPEGDQLQKRPMLVCFHSGGFMVGTKENDDMLEFCKIFAQKGYVTATAEYRLGLNFFSNISSERAVYRAVQDSRALLRYLRENASNLGISPDHIYILGSSAGALIVLHNLFMDKESERPASSFAINNAPTNSDNGPDLGTLDAIGSYFNQNSQANGVISLWGALKDTNLIEIGDPQIPVFLAHGTADNIVSFGYGSPFQLSTLSPTYGSELIDKRLTHINYPHQTYFVAGVGHEFYGVSNGMWDPAPNQYWDTIVWKVRDFLYNIHRPNSEFTFTQNNNEVTFTNNSSNAIAWHWDFGDGQSSEEQNPIHIFTQTGNYTVTLTSYSEVYSSDLSSSNINITTVGVKDESKLQSEFALYQNYPNPLNQNTVISYNLPVSGFVSLKLYDVFGNEVATLVNADTEAGYHKVEFNANGLSNGMYFYELRTDKFVEMKKMILLK
ncbi:MAG: carboxylesterase family protein [Chloroherpetonaceae bacterium]|nr:carboxylesterase family protein [bacterium]